MPESQFSSLPLTSSMLDNLNTLGYVEMTPVQSQALPHILEGRDLRAKAKTGSGKTAAFGIGLLHRLRVEHYRVQSLVLCPTRELADQVAKELRRLARATHNVKVLTLCGGMPFRPQLASLEHGAHIVVGTPGRVLKHLSKGSLQLEHLDVLVLDEADRMLDMGFSEEITEVFEYLPKKHQTLLFSATFPDAITELGADILHDPVEVSVASLHSETSIRQLAYECVDKHIALLQLLLHYKPASSIIFCNMKITAQEIADMLHEHGFDALALHGDLEQLERNEVLVQFANGSCSVLVATDVAARGLDIKALEAVVNYDLPLDPEVYIHRIGRTGRAGNEGLALTLYEERSEELMALEAIEDYQGHAIDKADLPVSSQEQSPINAPMVTLCIDGGKKQKIRPGDILGALTGEAGLDASSVGKIDINEFYAYVAIVRKDADNAFKKLKHGRIKGREFRIWKLD